MFVIRDRHGNTYSFNPLDTPHIVATNPIYVAEENPDIYIKVIRHPSLLEHPEEHAFIRNKIAHELKTAKTLSGNFFPVPHVYYTKIDTDSEYVTGYIVMDRIKGRVIKTITEFNRYLDKILVVLNDLMEFGVIYEDMNIANFIVGEEDDEIYVVDFEDTVPVSEQSRMVKHAADGTVSLNAKYIESRLKKSVKTHSSPKSSPRPKSKSKSKSKSPKGSPSSSPRKTRKQSPGK